MSVKNLSFLSCNFSDILIFCIILPIMIFTIMIMKLFVVGELYKERNGCWPISYYFGEINGCRRTIDGFENKNIFDNVGSTLSSKISNVIKKIEFFIYNIAKEKVF